MSVLSVLLFLSILALCIIGAFLIGLHSRLHPKVYGTSEVADGVEGLDPRRVRYDIEEGRLEAFRVGRGFGVYEDDARRYQEKMRKELDDEGDE